MRPPSPLPAFLPLIPRPHARIWGGWRLGPALPEGPTGELWVADGQSVVAAGPCAGQTVDDLIRERPESLLGQAAPGPFPLLVKLLDCQDWLSVQVHPDDAQAQALAGPGQRGKTEAWHILAAEPGAEIIAGLRPGVSEEAFHGALATGDLLRHCERHTVYAGDSVLLPAGTLHALGPGLLLYEVQQASDLTYRAYDWNRDAQAGRALHLDEVRRVTDVTLRTQITRAKDQGADAPLVKCPYFTLHAVRAGASLHTGKWPQIVTGLSGETALHRGNHSCPLPPMASVLVPAATGEFALVGDGEALVATSRPG